MGVGVLVGNNVGVASIVGVVAWGCSVMPKIGRRGIMSNISPRMAKTNRCHRASSSGEKSLKSLSPSLILLPATP